MPGDEQKPPQPAASVSEPDNLAEKIKKLEAERDEYLNGWKRAKADFINYKKDEGKRLEEAIVYGNAGLIKDLLSVLDSFDLAQIALHQGGNEANTATEKGLLLVKNQLTDILKKQGVEKIVVQPGEELDIRLHEPMSEVELNPADESQKSLAGKIIEEVVAGYTMHGRVIRPAKVKTGKLSSS